MSVFPVLEIEAKIQVNDKTRLTCEKSFVSTGATAISSVKIKPGATGSDITVSGTGRVAKDWYSDWMWTSWAFDVDTLCAKIDFVESGVSYVATVATSTYTSLSLLASAIETALNGAGAMGTFSVSVLASDALKISSTSAFELPLYSGDNRFSGLLQHLGFESDLEADTSHTGSPVEYGLRKVTATVDTVTQVIYQKVYSEKGDRLFAGDSDLQAYEEDILKWVAPGRSSHKDVHRKVQELILEWLASNGFQNTNRVKFKKWDICDLKEVRDWSVYMALRIIMEGNSNVVDDIYSQKAKKYASLENQAKNRFLQLDIDGDGKADWNETLDLHVANVVRR